MKKVIMIVTILTGLIARTVTAGVDATMNLASAYVFRGATVNDRLVFQPSIEAYGFALPDEYGRLTARVWGNFDIEGHRSDSAQFSEIDWYASYSLPSLVDELDLFVGYTEYTYPNQTDNNGPSWSDKEVNVGIGYEVSGVSFGATVYYGVGGGIDGQTYYDASVGYTTTICKDMEVGVGGLLGFLDQKDNPSGFNEGVFDAFLNYSLNDDWILGVSIAYIEQLDKEVLVDGPYGYDVNLVGMLSLGASF